MQGAGLTPWALLFVLTLKEVQRIALISDQGLSPPRLPSDVQMAHRHASAPRFAVRALVGSEDIVQLPPNAATEQRARQQDEDRLPPKAASWPWQRSRWAP